MIAALTSLLVLMLIRTASAGSSFEVLHSFANKPRGCPEPGAPVIFDKVGNLYGTTTFWNGCAFELMPQADGHWKETTLYAFPKYSNTDGAQPWAPVVFDSTGNLYGTTVVGGGTDCFHLGCGTIFELTPTAEGHWKEKIIYRFKDQGDGYWPQAGGLTFDAFGNLYGTTSQGGNLSCNQGYGCGTVFKLSKGRSGSWRKATLYAFAGGRDGAFVWDGVIWDSAGNLYGVTPDCFDGSCPGNGTVFELVSVRGKWKHKVLFRFTGGSNANPLGTLAMDPEGNLYGTTQGAACCGNVFRLSRSGKKWTEEILHTFNGIDGALPTTGVILDKAGNLFGTTLLGGSKGEGTVFALKHSNNNSMITVLHSFYTGYAGNDGYSPAAPLTFGPDGALYGTTLYGGPAGDGTVFRILP